MLNFRNKSESTIRKQKFIHLPIRFRKIIKTNNFQYFTVGNINNHISCLPVGISHLNHLIQNSSTEDETPFLSKPEELALFMKTATEVRITKQGTLNIPIEIVKNAGITSKIVFTGAISHFEVWDTQIFFDEVMGSSMEFEEILSLLEKNTSKAT